MIPTGANAATWAICAGATAGVVARPFRWPEAVWAVAGAGTLVVLGLLPLGTAAAAVGRGGDVYLFLAGMMLLSAVARAEGLFDWVAATAAINAKGSTAQLFALIYLAGIVTTTFLSNDATAVVLTPAVYAAARKADADPLPMLFACAMVANAASFVLPISNPANLVLYGGRMPALAAWFASFALPAAAAIVATFLALRVAERDRLRGPCAGEIKRRPLSTGGKAALIGISVTALLLLAMAALDRPLGPPTALAGLATAVVVAAIARTSPFAAVRGAGWGVLPLVAGLFVLVDALGRTGVTGRLANLLGAASVEPVRTSAIAGTTLAIASNLTNNLPAGLVAATAVAQAHLPRIVVDGLLIGVDLGPNLSITGSLATILWLQAIRREGADVGFGRFLKVGILVMPPALIAALAIRIATN